MSSSSDLTLSIAIDSAGLNAIQGANQRVTLALIANSFVETAWATQRGAAAAPLCGVAWQAFEPPLQTNIVSWNGGCYPYATATPLTVNQVITIGSITAVPAVEGWTYQFADGQFNGTPGTGAAVQLVNNTPGASFSFGLAQAATVNGFAGLPAPLCVAPVLYDEAAQFQLSGMAVAIFLSTASANGTVIPQPLPSNALTVTPVAGETATIGFNDSTNEFYLQPAG